MALVLCKKLSLSLFVANVLHDSGRFNWHTEGNKISENMEILEVFDDARKRKI